MTCILKNKSVKLCGFCVQYLHWINICGNPPKIHTHLSFVAPFYLCFWCLFIHGKFIYLCIFNIMLCDTFMWHFIMFMIFQANSNKKKLHWIMFYYIVIKCVVKIWSFCLILISLFLMPLNKSYINWNAGWINSVTKFRVIEHLV